MHLCLRAGWRYQLCAVLSTFLLRYEPRPSPCWFLTVLHSHLNFWEAKQWCCSSTQQGEGGQASAEQLQYMQYHGLCFMCHKFDQKRFASSPNIMRCFLFQQLYPNRFIFKLLTWHKAGYEIYYMMCHPDVLCVQVPMQQLLVSAAQLKNIHVRTVEHVTFTCPSSSGCRRTSLVAFTSGSPQTMVNDDRQSAA